MVSETRQPRSIPEPKREWTDTIVESLRRSPIVIFFGVIYDRVVPLLFALIVAAPVGLLVLPVFVPKFIRNEKRRRRYRVRLVHERIERIRNLT